MCLPLYLYCWNKKWKLNFIYFVNLKFKEKAKKTSVSNEPTTKTTSAACFNSSNNTVPNTISPKIANTTPHSSPAPPPANSSKFRKASLSIKTSDSIGVDESSVHTNVAASLFAYGHRKSQPNTNVVLPPSTASSINWQNYFNTKSSSSKEKASVRAKIDLKLNKIDDFKKICVYFCFYELLFVILIAINFRCLKMQFF